MQDNNSSMQSDTSDSTEKQAFALARQGTLEIVELMSAADRLNAAGRKDLTVSLYRLWLEHTTSPLAFVACFNLGVVLGEGREYEQAEKMYRRTLELNPDFLRARLNLGNNLEQQKREDEALEQWRTALKSPSILLPENLQLHLHALNNLGRLLEIRKSYQESLSMLEKSFALDPTQRDVLLHLVHLTQKICRWPIYNPPKGITKEDMIAGTSPLAMLAASDDPALQLSAARKFVEHKYPVNSSEALAPKEGYSHSKIRIGYLSSDFCLHAVSLLTVELLELHNHDKFEVYGFCWSREDGTSIQKRVVGAMDHYIKIDTMSDREAADCIRSHEIDILVDLQGLTSGARPLILSYRPATLQITYLGFPGTTGLPWIDYVIADRFLIPEELVPFHTEKPLYMPKCFQSSDSRREVGLMPTRKDNGLPEKAFVFCSFNNNYKFTPELFAAWMRILKKVPGSVFWLLADNEWSKENLLKTARKMGIKKERLIFAPRVAPADYLARYQLADLFLDTFPFNGGTTANDALFMGLPLLTLTGRTFASRMAGSLLNSLQLPELITTSLADYEKTAISLATNPKKLLQLKERLRTGKTSTATFNTSEFIKEYESALESVVLRSGGQPVVTQTVPHSQITGISYDSLSDMSQVTFEQLSAGADQLQKDGHIQDALVLYKSWLMVSQDPRRHLTLNRMAGLYEDLMQLDLAEEALTKSLELNRDQPEVIQHWAHIRQKSCKWPVIHPLSGISSNRMLMSISPTSMLHLTDDPVQQLLSAHTFAERTRRSLKEALYNPRTYNHERIRIGYLLTGPHLPSSSLLPGVAEGQHRTRFEFFCYAASPEAVQSSALFDHVRPIHLLNDHQSAELIMGDEIDVLIELHGPGSASRPGIFALRPAPSQGTYLGHAGTTAMPWFDFIIADKTVLPDELTPYFTEKPVYLDSGIISRKKDQVTSAKASRSDFGLPEGAFVMAAFGDVCKITAQMFDTWLTILKKLDNSILWLIDDNRSATTNLLARAGLAGIPSSRIIFTSGATTPEIRTKLQVADLFLDTFPHGCCETAIDVVQAELPMITMEGRAMASRTGKSVLNFMGMTGNIATTHDEYVELAIKNSRRLAIKVFRTRILVIRQLAMGDVILTTPIVKKLFHDYQGQCTIDILTRKPDIFNNSPWVNEVFTPDSMKKNLLDYDKIINLDLAYEKLPRLHIVDAYSYYSHGFEFRDSEKKLELFASFYDRIYIREKMKREIGQDYLVIHMRNDTWPSRNLPLATWKQIVDTLLEKTALHIVQVGSSHEIAFNHHPRLLNYLDKFTVHELKCVIEDSALYVGIDSGTLHIAGTTEVPIICLFTSAHHDTRKPMGRKPGTPFIPITPKLDCYGCQKNIAPPITGVVCPVGDPYAPPCISAFDITDIERALARIPGIVSNSSRIE